MPEKIPAYAADLAGREKRPASLLPLNQIPEKTGHLWPWDVGFSRGRSVLGLKPSQVDGDLDDEAGDPLEQDDDHGHLSEDCCAVKAADLGFVEDGEILLGRGVGSLGSGAEALSEVKSIRSAENAAWGIGPAVVIISSLP